MRARLSQASAYEYSTYTVCGQRVGQRLVVPDENILSQPIPGGVDVPYCAPKVHSVPDAPGVYIWTPLTRLGRRSNSLFPFGTASLHSPQPTGRDPVQ